MRIAIDGRTIVRQRTGVGVYAERLVRALLALDATNAYTLFMAEDDPSLDAPHLTKVILPRSTSMGPNRAWENFVLPRHLEREQIDIYFSPAYILPILRRSRKRTHRSQPPYMVVTLHDLVGYLYPETFTLKMRLWQRLYVRNAVRVADCILADSEATKADIHRFHSIPDEIVKVVHLPIDARFKPITESAELDPVRSRFNLPDKFILYVGTLEPRKNVIRLAKAFASLPEGIRAEYSLVLAGGMGWFSEGIREEIDALHLQHQVRFLGYVDQSQLPALYTLASVFAYVSLYEGFGAPPVEAMACGTPVICSNVSSLPEVVGTAGLLVDPLNIRAITEGLSRLTTDEMLRKSLSVAGIGQAGKFRVEEKASQVLQVFKELDSRTKR